MRGFLHEKDFKAEVEAPLGLKTVRQETRKEIKQEEIQLDDFENSKKPIKFENYEIDPHYYNTVEPLNQFLDPVQTLKM